MSTELLDLVQSAINDVEKELHKLDGFVANAETGKSTIARLTAELADLHGNKAGLDVKVRANKLTTGNALLSLEQSDLKAINSDIDAQSDCVVQFSGRAIGPLQELWSAVLAVRKADIEETIRRTFDLARIRIVTPEMLVAASHLVIEFTELEGSLFIFRSRNDRAASVDDARHLREGPHP